MGKYKEKKIEIIPIVKDNSLSTKSYSLMKSFIAIIATIISYTSGGVITPDPILPFALSSTDRGDRADYEFKMQLATTTTVGCSLEVHFPSNNYPEDLGLFCNIKGYYPSGNQIPVTIQGRIVKFYPQEVIPAATSFVIQIDDIQNPSIVGQTDQFQIYQICNNVPIDSNLNFGQVTITEPVYFNGGRLIPDKTFPITLSSTNAGDRAEYNFTMSLTSKITPDCKIKIEFPDQQYIDGLGLDYNFKAYYPYGTLIPSTVNGKVLSLTPGSIPKGESFTLTIEGIQNPFKIGGTGLFKAYSVCGTNEVLVDVCEDYTSIAVTAPKIKILKTNVTVENGYSDVAGMQSNYLFYISPTTELNKNTVFRVTFPDFYNFTYLNQLVTDFPSEIPCEAVADPTTGYKISGNITCKFNQIQDNIIEWVGNNKTIPKNSPIWLRLKGVYNPTRELKTEFLKIDLVLKNTNFTYEYDDSVEGLVIQPGSVNNFKVQPVLDTPLEPLTDYDFTISFTPTNKFKSIRIVTRFREIFSCIVRNALIPDNAENEVNCVINSNVLDITSIKEYYRKYKENADKIQILVRGKTSLAAGTQLPCEVYTYLNNDFTIKVDQNLTSADSSLFISTSPPDQPMTAITFTSTYPDAGNVMTNDIRPLVNYTAASYDVTVKLVFSPLFTFGVTQLEPIRCHYRQLHQWLSSYYNSEGILVFVTNTNLIEEYLDCAADSENPSVLSIPLKLGDIRYPLIQHTAGTLQEENILTITNLKNPSVFGTYDIDLLVYINGNAEPVEKKRVSITITAPPFTANLISYVKNRGMDNLLEVKFDAPLDLPRANRGLDNYYDEFSRIELSFPQVVGATNTWRGDLGYIGISDLSYIPCWAGDDVTVYREGLRCQLKLGKLSGTITASDAPVIVISNYKKLSVGARVKISFMVTNPTTASSPTVRIGIVKVISNQPFELASTTIVLPGSPLTNAGGVAFTAPGFTTNPTPPSPQAKHLFTFSFTQGADVPVNDLPFFMIKMPPNYKFSTSLFSPSTIKHDYTDSSGSAKTDQYFEGKYYYDNYSNRLVINRQDTLLDALNVINIDSIEGSVGQGATENIEINYYDQMERRNTFTTAIGAVTANPVGGIVSHGVTVNTNIQMQQALGVMYEFEWTSFLDYPGEWRIEVGFDTTFGYSLTNTAELRCELFVNDLQQHSVTGEYKQACLYNQANVVPGTVTVTSWMMDVKKPIEKGSKVKIQLFYMNHPTAGSTPNFEISVTANTNTTTPKVVCYSPVILPAGLITIPSTSPRTAEIVNFWAYPLNANQEQTMYFDLKFDTYLPKGTEIEVRLPLDYIQVKSRVDAECYLIGAHRLVQLCDEVNDASNRNIIFQIAEDYIANSQIRLQFAGYALFTKPTFNNVTDNTIGNFNVLARFGGYVLSDDGSIVKTMRIYGDLSIAQTLPEPSIVFYPTNEAEKATYNFTISMNQLVDFWEDDKIWIRFPLRYDLHLSKNKISVMSNELQGALHFEVHNREIMITGFYPGRIPNKVTISIHGITNPNNLANNPITGFHFGLFNRLNMTRGLRNNFGSLLLTDAPEIIEIISMTNNIQYARYDDNYTMEVNSHVPFPDSNTGAKIVVEYPEDFIMDVFLAKCQTDEFFSLYSTCTQYYNSMELISANNEYDTISQGSFKININGVRNAEYAGLTAPIVVKNYDTVNQRVLSRSFGTLSDSYVNFKLDGLDLYANDGKEYNLEIGSFSNPIRIGPAETMKQRLTVVPLYFDSNFLFENVPSTLVPDTKGSCVTIAAPQDMLRTQYYITWFKSGDSQTKFYAPIPKMPVNIIKVIKPRKLVLGSVAYVNRGGLSIPIEITTVNPPYDDVSAQISKVGVVSETSKISLNQTTIQFTKGVYLKRYRIENLDNSYSPGTIDLSYALQGTDSPSFQFNPTAATISIVVNNADLTPASFEDLSVAENNRGNVKMYIKSNKLAYLYCVTAYRYMKDPTYEEVRDRNLDQSYSYSLPIYTTAWTKTQTGTNFENTFIIDGLKPGTEYTTYCYTMNLNRVPSTTFVQVSFVNKPPQKIATFTMKVNQEIVSQELREEYLKRLATLMSVTSDRVRLKLNCVSDPPVGSDEGSTYITFYVLPEETNEDEDISPINKVRQLNRQRADIKKFVPKLDDGNLLVMEEVKSAQPNFKQRPILSKEDFFTLEINSTLTSCGYLVVSAQPIQGTRYLEPTKGTTFFYENQLIKGVYDPAIEYYPYGIDNAVDENIEFVQFGGSEYIPSVSVGSSRLLRRRIRRRRMLKVLLYTTLSQVDRYPTSFQMSKLLNQTNEPEVHVVKTAVTDYSKETSVIIEGLQDNIIYNVYVSAMNDLPEFPDYMDNDYVAQLNVKTLKKRRRLVIYSVHSSRIYSIFTCFSISLLGFLIWK